MAMQPVELEKFYRLINHGPTTIVSAAADGVENAMSAAWVCALDFMPKAKISVILDKQAFTRSLVEKSGELVVQIPVVRQAELVVALGESRKDNPQKMDTVERFYQNGIAAPFVKGCAAWLHCKVIPEPENHQNHDLFVCEVLSAWADDEIFSQGHWHFETADTGWRTLHYIAGGHFYAIGDAIDVG
ncbi:flavin reductase family protein [Neisseria weixii]|uniref:flavin reductase family protein n=1 Tax=Neisseria weixii TaxID=1853276 RepID=UPI0035A168EB